VVDHHHLGLGRRLHVLSRHLLLVIRIVHHHPQLIVTPDRTLQLRPDRLLPGLDLPFQEGEADVRHVNDNVLDGIQRHSLPIPVDFPVGRRLMKFYQNWEAVTDDPWILEVVRIGYRLEFVENPVLSPRPPFTRIPLSERVSAVLTEEVNTLLEKGAVALLQPPYSPGFYSNVFTVSKKDSDKLRLVINLSPLNRLLEKNRFKMETPSTITAALRQGDWTVSIDLTDAYLHVPMHPSAWKYLRFTLGERVFEFRALPFGLSPAPFVFTRMMSIVSQVAHKRLLHLFLYLDDSLMRNTTRFRLLVQIPLLTEIFDLLGFLRNERKSCLIPSQQFIFLGVYYDLLQAIARIPEDRWQKISNIIPVMLSKHTSPARSWCVLIGLLTSAQNYVLLGRLHVRRLQLQLNRYWVPRSDMSVPIPLSETCRQQLRWWLNREHVMMGVSILPFSPSVHLFTDASTQGWGAHVGDLLLSGVWSKGESSLHSNILEMKAVLLAVQQSLHILSNQSILLSTDNSTVVCYVNKQGGTHSPSLFLLVEELLLLLHQTALRSRQNTFRAPGMCWPISYRDRTRYSSRSGPFIRE
jgi:hypothetical protein